LVVKNVGSVVVEPGKRATDVEEGFLGDFQTKAVTP
jgi:hypothetical protein